MTGAIKGHTVAACVGFQDLAEEVSVGETMFIQNGFYENIFYCPFVLRVAFELFK